MYSMAKTKQDIVRKLAGESLVSCSEALTLKSMYEADNVGLLLVLCGKPFICVPVMRTW
ncbi:uncharacterized protein PHALS_04879 [Plasmopara halstedii]|uniref:Uncharacterized protein n=1 Tax=Plasmopara halstedii TaxID=4781 RepID=A0A0P1B2S8_PLAHL|nr:uncharacterized protein PHALS_04879 [Plasmopara halstedii]CEG47736.1 hypothetical protein PHALS_04879 [Plasmopara halstedii]|eukprot:XP_024584105.1 hypothetical protein PHALS_04879 [Plasmopara halstedii]